MSDSGDPAPGPSGWSVRQSPREQQLASQAAQQAAAAQAAAPQAWPAAPPPQPPQVTVPAPAAWPAQTAWPAPPPAPPPGWQQPGWGWQTPPGPGSGGWAGPPGTLPYAPPPAPAAGGHGRLWVLGAVGLSIAVAIGLLAAGVAGRPTASPSGSTTGLPSIPQGHAVAGGDSGTGIVWHTETTSIHTVTAIAGGANVSLTGSVEDWLTPVFHREVVAMRVDASITMHGSDGDRQGIGCMDGGGKEMYLFLITGQGTWAVHDSTDDTYGAVIGSGYSTLIKRGSAGNTLSLFCDTVGATDHLMFAINGTTVSILDEQSTTHRSGQTWGPVVALCSCAGPSDADFTQMKVATVSNGP